MLLRLVSPVLPPPDVPHRGPVPSNLCAHHHHVPRRLLHAPLVHKGEGHHDTRPKDDAHQQRRHPEHHAADPRQDLEHQEQEHDKDAEHDHVGRVVEGLGQAVEQGVEDGRHEGEERVRQVEELASEGLQGRGGREHVCVEKVEGVFGEEGL